MASAGWLTGYSGASAADFHRFPYSRSIHERTGLGWPFLAAEILAVGLEAVNRQIQGRGRIDTLPFAPANAQSWEDRRRNRSNDPGSDVSRSRNRRTKVTLLCLSHEIVEGDKVGGSQSTGIFGSEHLESGSNTTYFARPSDELNEAAGDSASSLLTGCLVPIQSACRWTWKIGRRNGFIRAFAGMRAGRRSMHQLSWNSSGGLANALLKLDHLADGADFLLGHNLIDFDLPHLRAVNSNLRMLQLPAVDTLRLNPLAFPRNPYHHLVKHYQDGQLVRGRINDPELDARLTLAVFANQIGEFRRADPRLLTAWHWLTTADGGDGFDIFFALA